MSDKKKKKSDYDLKVSRVKLPKELYEIKEKPKRRVKIVPASGRRG